MKLFSKMGSIVDTVLDMILPEVVIKITSESDRNKIKGIDLDKLKYMKNVGVLIFNPSLLPLDNTITQVAKFLFDTFDLNVNIIHIYNKNDLRNNQFDYIIVISGYDDEHNITLKDANKTLDKFYKKVHKKFEIEHYVQIDNKFPSMILKNKKLIKKGEIIKWKWSI